MARRRKKPPRKRRGRSLRRLTESFVELRFEPKSDNRELIAAWEREHGHHVEAGPASRGAASA